MAPGGRSTGCKTCRMRHVKCDEARPMCRRCQKAGIECRGYDVIEVFVDERSKILQRGSKSRPDRRKRLGSQSKGQANGAITLCGPVVSTWTLGSTDGENTPTSPSSVGSPSSQVSAASWESAESITRVHSPTVSPLTTVLPLMEDDIYLTFMLKRMFSRMQTPMTDSAVGIRDSSMGDRRRSWLIPVLREGRDAAPLGSALAALGRAWFAKAENQPTVATQGMKHYSKALVELKRAISEDSWRQRHVLIAAMLLALYETVMMEDNNAWVNHTKGLAHLFEAQGPQSFQDEVGLGILRANRYGMIMSAIITGKRSFLERQEWRSIPWQRLPHIKTDNDYLFDTLATVPGLLKDVTEWEMKRSSFPHRAMAGIMTSLQELCEWRWGYEMANPATVHMDEAANELPPSPFLQALRFDTMIGAHVISVYGSTMILLLLLAQRLQGANIDFDSLVGPVPADLVKSNPLILPGFDRLDVAEIAREICRTIKFRMHYMKSSAIAFSLLLPMRVTWQILKDYPLESQWLQSVAVLLQQHSALQFPRLMFDGDSSHLFREGSRIDNVTDVGMQT